ncbi:MAG: ATP-binding cassette domain-containing protein [Nitratireductor sp.]
MPDGYSTDLSQGMQVLSGGQVQRIALARAVLGNPPLVVLDEPNSNLDAEGDAALARAIEILRKKKSCVVVMAHRPSAIAAVNKLLMLKDGLQVEFGDKKEVLRKVTRPVPENVPPRAPITARMDMMRPDKVMLKGDS